MLVRMSSPLARVINSCDEIGCGHRTAQIDIPQSSVEVYLPVGIPIALETTVKCTERVS